MHSLAGRSQRRHFLGPSPSSSRPIGATVVSAGQPLEPGRVHSRFASLAAAEYGLSSAAAPACLELFESIAFDFIDEFPSALGHDTPVLQDMDNIRLDIFQKFLIMSDNDG